MARGRGCKVGVNLHREQDEYTPANSRGNRTLFVISTWGRAILDQLADVAGYGIARCWWRARTAIPAGLGWLNGCRAHLVLKQTPVSVCSATLVLHRPFVSAVTQYWRAIPGFSSPDPSSVQPTGAEV